MGEFARILRISKPLKVALQLLQTMSIMIQNLRSEHAICKWCDWLSDLMQWLNEFVSYHICNMWSN